MNSRAYPPHGLKKVTPPPPAAVVKPPQPITPYVHPSASSYVKTFKPFSYKAKAYEDFKKELLDKEVAFMLLYFDAPNKIHPLREHLAPIQYSAVLYHWSVYKQDRAFICDAKTEVTTLIAHLPAVTKQEPLYSSGYCWVRDVLGIAMNADYVGSVPIEKCYGVWLWRLADDAFDKVGEFNAVATLSLRDKETFNATVDQLLAPRGD